MISRCINLPDYHIHTPFCGHAGGEMEEYVLAARELGPAGDGFCRPSAAVPYR